MRSEADRGLAVRIMDDFADRTSITADEGAVRYLWTDSFAVCNYLGLYSATGEARFLDLARALVEQVHRVLGRHRPDDLRTGWISGLSETEGARRPTAGGLRIGKRLPERAASEPYHPSEEWDRDGQYYHYLTKWTFALHRMWRVTDDPVYYRWAVELLKAAHAAFSVDSPSGRRLCWKMSIDLSRPLVASAGHHDPLDGLIQTSILCATGPDASRRSELDAQLEDLSGLCEGVSWATSDPLGAGGLLVDTLRCAQLARRGHPTGPRLFSSLLHDGLQSLGSLGDFTFLREPARHRLAFRELGLALGIGAMEWCDPIDPARVAPGVRANAIVAALEAVRSFAGHGRAILDFWARDASRSASTWTEHRDISEVMWATCLAPEGFLEL